MSQRVFEGNKLVIASHNEGKIKEIRDLLKPLKIDVLSAKDFKMIEPDENGVSFEENALIKSSFVSKQSGLPSLSDDSGICFPDLNNSPGIYSARWAGKNKNFIFICSLSLAWPDGYNVTVSGKVDGVFTWPPRGKKGFGYDPIFTPLGHNMTFAEMEPDFKHGISHRSFAFKKLIDLCFPTLKTL